ncbi:hypothetical protein FOCC_FOCC013616 [Frankliniella occidentalis]|nr:hypothetical protein FOCC_FOCC013616 [Frankliniella occidentalis]
MSRISRAGSSTRKTTTGSTFYLNFLRRKIREEKKMVNKSKMANHPYKASSSKDRDRRRQRSGQSTPITAEEAEQITDPLTAQLQQIFNNPSAEVVPTTASNTITTYTSTTTNTSTTTMYTAPIMTTTYSQKGPSSPDQEPPLNLSEDDVNELMETAITINSESQDIIPSSQPPQPSQHPIFKRRATKKVQLLQMNPEQYNPQKISPKKVKTPAVKVHIQTLDEAREYMKYRTDEDIEKVLREAQRFAEEGKEIPNLHQCHIDSMFILNEELECEENDLNPPKKFKETTKPLVSFRGSMIKTLDEAYNHLKTTDKGYIDSHLDNVLWKQDSGEPLDPEEQKTIDAVRTVEYHTNLAKEKEEQERIKKQEEKDKAEKEKDKAEKEKRKKEEKDKAEKDKKDKKKEKDKEKEREKDKEKKKELEKERERKEKEKEKEDKRKQSKNTSNLHIIIPPPSDNQSGETPKDPRKQPRKKGPPPIVLEKVTNFGELQTVLLERVGAGKFECRARGPSVTITTKTDIDWHSIQEALRSRNYRFHTYTREATKPIQLVIRYIHTTISNEQIQDELEDMGFKITNVYRVNKEGIPTDEVNIDIENNELAHSITEVTQLMNHKIRIMERKKPLVTICTRCSGYHHSRASCYKSPKCPKCSMAHPLSECTSTVPKCPNCEKDREHPATYRGCPTYKEEEKKVKEKQNIGRTPSATPKPTHQNPWLKETLHPTGRQNTPKTPSKSDNDIEKFLRSLRPKEPIKTNQENPEKTHNETEGEENSTKSTMNFLSELIDTKDIMKMLTDTLKEAVKPLIATLIQWVKDNLAKWLKENMKTLVLNLIKECLPS